MNEFRSPAVLAMDIIRYIGDQVSESGEPIEELSAADLQSTCYAPSEGFTEQLVEELIASGSIRMIGPEKTGGGAEFYQVNLTLKGWEQYEAEKRGGFAGNYGFLAMQFNEHDLDTFVKDVLKPAVKTATDCDLVDVRDVAKAGIIDNIIRVQIRDAKFIIVDLTHDNHGAYWEAGYAEGLGKPVIYICEKKKFDKKGTHFDTNHCTTVPWSRDDDDGFRQELTATLRRSLDLLSIQIEK